MKNFFLISLTFLFILHSGIIDTLFDIKQEELREEVQSELRFEKSHILKLTFQQFEDLAVSNNEILINNEFHDIISLKKENKVVYVTVAKDQKENNYLAKTKDYKNKNSSPKNKFNSFKYKLVYCCFNWDFKINTVNYPTAQESTFHKTTKLSKRMGEVIIPPPELA